MESTGVCYRIVLDETAEQIKIEGKFKLPGLNKSMNLEGVALFESDEKIKIFYGDRVSNTRPSTLFHADYNVQEDDVKVVGSYSLTLLEQMPEKRNIADLVFDESGNLWSSATSDPGNDGPFETRIFRIGKISKQGYFTLEKPLKSKKTFKRCFRNNKKSILKMLNLFKKDLSKLENAVENNDDKFLLNLFTKTRKIRKDIVK